MPPIPCPRATSPHPQHCATMSHALNLSLGSGQPLLLQSNPEASAATDHSGDHLELLSSQSVFRGRAGEVQEQQLFFVNKEVEDDHRRAGDQGLHLTLGFHGEGDASRPCWINGSSPPAVVKAGEPSPNRNFVRVCVFCNTSKTPLWRGGPHGPKSLCNACGIRYRKARRALAAAVTDSGARFPPNPPILALNRPDLMAKRRKQCRHPAKFAGRRREKLGLTAYATECVKGRDPRDGLFYSSAGLSFGKGLSRRSAFHQVLPKEEEDAAKLLMALSYGLVHG